ncbi:MAG: 23S rRNA (guanosine(2251)-2'-O)-methyltransferase RlmB [Gammaproteobacteria bacterium]|nr:23S rRNA (guanosine(2251)-2'-O)-methyltransferase RlmB [Gammaproteobacteria bacterium]
MSSKQLIYGLHAVQALLDKEPESVSVIWIDKSRHDKRLQTVLGLAKMAGIKIQKLERKMLDELSGHQQHQGVVAESSVSGVWDEARLMSLLESLDEPPFLLILDGVTDPHNLGACLRSANGAGIHAVIAPKDKACSLTGTVRKVASGAAESTPLVQVTNLARTLGKLKEQGIWLVGTTGNASQSLYETDLKGPLGIVMGAEGQGMRRLTTEACDFLVKLPMLGQVESLNVSVTTGICLYEAVRQRQNSR